MSRFESCFIFTLISFAFLLVFPACERTVEEEVIRPIESMYGQKNVAAAQAAAVNVNTVRAALMRFPAASPSNVYPGETDIYDYSTLRQVLSGENLPSEMAELMWDPAYGIEYTSDGYTFTFKVKALYGEGEVITATPGGVVTE